MKSLKELYKTGRGPSSSHTMGPEKACRIFGAKYPDADEYEVTLYGSLSATGKGHLTDTVLNEIFLPFNHSIEWRPETFLPRHPNALKFEAYDSNESLIASQIYYSVGGGTVVDEGSFLESKKVYPLTKLDDILRWCNDNGRQLWEYVVHCEGAEILDFLDDVWSVMADSIKKGLEGNLRQRTHPYEQSSLRQPHTSCHRQQPHPYEQSSLR